VHSPKSVCAHHATRWQTRPSAPSVSCPQ
jgi:hypothetical protein